MKQLPILLFLFSLPAFCRQSAQSHIIIDGRFEDWTAIDPAAENSGQTLSATDLRLLRLRVADDSGYLYLMLELNQEILLQEGNRLTLYLDIDDNAATGQPIADMGADVSYTFGERKGHLWTKGDTIALEYQHLGLVGAPSMTSSRFEWALSWDALGSSGQPTLLRGPLRLLLRDEAGGGALPAQGSLRWATTLMPRPALPAVDFDRRSPSHLRLVSHNVNRRHMQSDKKDAFSRIYRALDPDFLLLQEAYDGSAEEIRDYFLPALGSSPSGAWYAYKAGAEATVLISPFPALQVTPLGNSAAYLLDLPAPYSTKLVLIALSLPCCRQDSARQAEADLIMAFVRDLVTTGGTIDVPKGAPIVLAGDANLVGYPAQYQTLLTGAIQDTMTYGPPFAPDWDGTPFTDLHPPQLQRPMTFTWRGNGFFPGRLDYIFYTDSVLRIGRNFVFDTPGLPTATQEKYQLKETDAPDTYHHLPLVVDLAVAVVHGP